MLGRWCSKSQERKISLVPENVLKKRKAYQALRVTQAKRSFCKGKSKGKKKSSNISNQNGSYIIPGINCMTECGSKD